MSLFKTLFRPFQRAFAGGVVTGPAVVAAKPISNIPPELARILRPEAVGRWMLPQLASITPQYIESVLRGAMAGGHVQQWELFDLMEDTWPRLLKNLLEVKRAVRRLDWKLEPWAEDGMAPTAKAEEKSRLVSNALWRMNPRPDRDENDFDATVFDLLDSWAKGTSVVEVDWSIRKAGPLGKIAAPVCTTWVPPSKYAWQPEEGWLGLVQGSQSSYAQQISSRAVSLVPFPANKFLIAICKAKTGHPISSALLRPLAWWWCAANFSADWLLNLAQVFGLPFRWANYSTNAPKETVQAICGMLENMGSAGWAAFPEGTKLELKEASKTGDASPQGDLLDRADKQADLLILGQTLTTDVGDSGSRALGEVHQGVRSDVIMAAADFVASVINRQLIPMIVRLNYGDDSESPEMCPQPQTVNDAKANAERDAILLGAGAEIPLPWFHERHNIPMPQKGEAVVKGRPAQSTPAAPGANPEPSVKAAKSPVPEADHDSIEELAVAREKDLRILREQIERILKISDADLRMQKLKEFRQGLPQTMKDINAMPDQAAVIYDRLVEATVSGFATKEPSKS